MQRRELSSRGPSASALGLGCMGMSGLYGPADRAESIATIHAALDAGVDLLDTGDFYGMGHNEMLLGEALDGVPRDRAADQRQVRRAARPRRRLARLRRPPGGREERRRLLAAAPRHRPHRHLPPGTARPERARSRTPSAPSPSWSKAGYVRHVGLSEVGADTIRRAHAVHPIADLQIEYSLISRGIEDAILPACRELGIGVTAYGVLSRGLISGHWTKDRDTDARRLPQPQPALPGRQPAITTWRWSRRCARSPKTRASASRRLAIAWVLARGGDIVPLVGARSRDPAGGSAGRPRRGPGPRRRWPPSNARCRAAPPPATAMRKPQMAMLDSEQ